MSEAIQSPEMAKKVNPTLNGTDETPKVKTSGNTMDLDQKLIGVSLEVKVSTKPYSDYEDEPIVTTLKLNFSNASINDILPDVQKSAVIRWQARMRKDPDALIAMDGTTVDVDITEKGRRGDIGPRRAIGLIKRKVEDGSLDPKALREMIKELEAQLK